MNLIPPRLFGPLSECSRSVSFENAIPGATVVLVRIRGGAPQDVGKVVTTLSHGTVALEPGEEFAAGDLASVYQVTSSGSSPHQRDSVAVQDSDDGFNPPQVLTHLIECSRGFAVGAVRPGSTVEVLQGGAVIARGEATNGAANLRVLGDTGLPLAGALLTVRQRVCPRPTPPFGAPQWIIDHPLPPVEPLPGGLAHGGPLRAPKIVSGLSDCSRSVQVERILPGAEVIIEEAGGGWWVARGPSDATSATIELPVPLREGEEVVIRQEVGRYCEMEPERRPATAGPYDPLDPPQLFTIECHSDPTVYLSGLKVGADIEFEVAHQGQTTLYRSMATQAGGAFPAPPMPEGALVRVRQGECANWSAWSDPPETAKALARPVLQPQIAGRLVECQNSVTVTDIDPLAGTLRVISARRGEIAKVPAFGNILTVTVAPSLARDDDIFVEHEVCGARMGSPPQRVLPLVDPGIGEMAEPLYDGEGSVTVEEVTPGAYVEIWDQNGRLTSGTAPPTDGDKAAVAFAVPGGLRAGQHIHARFWHCGHYGRNEGRPVVFRRPELHAVHPSSAAAGGGPLTISCEGLHFRPGARISATGGEFTATFISDRELRTTLPAHFVATPMTQKILVRNPDGQFTAIKEIAIVQPLPPPPAELRLALENHSGNHFDITGVVWTVWRKVGDSFGPAMTASGTSATIAPAAAGQYHINVAVAARRLATGEDELADFRGHAPGPGGAKTHVVVWSGTAMSSTFRLIAEGQPDGLYNAVVLLQS